MGFRTGTAEYVLSHPIKTAHSGEHVDVNRIVLHEPKAKHAGFTLRIRQMVTRGSMEGAKALGALEGEADTAGQELPDPKAIDEQKYEQEAEEQASFLEVVLSMSDVDISKFVSLFEALITGSEPIAFIEGDHRFTKAHWD